MLSKLPGPLKRTTSADACVKRFVDGLANRRRRVNVPGWVGLFQWLKPVLSTRVGERETLRHAQRLVPLMDEQVQRLGRSLSERSATQQQSTLSTH